jgi:hypothetical protein
MRLFHTDFFSNRHQHPWKVRNGSGWYDLLLMLTLGDIADLAELHEVLQAPQLLHPA